MQWVDRNTDPELMETLESTGSFDLFSHLEAPCAAVPALETDFKHLTLTPKADSDENSSSAVAAGTGSRLVDEGAQQAAASSVHHPVAAEPQPKPQAAVQPLGRSPPADVPYGDPTK